MQVNDTLHGFKVTHTEEVSEVKGTVYTLEHEKTGAELVYIKNEDPNKVFFMGFRTPSQDDTGVFHILEHSVLNGSRKYPLKEPFVDLLKGSLHTFLNAMTYPEKTVYPIASMNDQDFANLMDTYMDAVLFPNVRHKKEIFLQEGWHYEFNDEDELVYGGVVFNEMKGAMSSSARRYYQAMEAALYPDSPYATNSGGAPLSIPDLTWEQLVDAHATYYHPSNSLTFLYGDLDIEDRLKHIAEYLDEFDALDLSGQLGDLSGGDVLPEKVVEFPLSESEDQEGQAYLGFGAKLTEAEETVTNELDVAFTVLIESLIDSESAPLRKALLQAGLGKDVSANYDNGSPIPSFTLAVSQSDAEKKEQFMDVLFSTIKELAENGIDKKVIQAAVASIEFRLREADFGRAPEGLFHGLSMITAHVAGKNKVDSVKYEEALNYIKSELDNQYFEKLLQKHFLDNKQKTIVVAKPSTTIGQKEYEKEQEALKEANAQLTEETKAEIQEQFEKLKAFQNMEDSPEDKAKLPKLNLEDIDTKPIPLPTEESEVEGVPLLVHPQTTNKLAYFTLYFDAGDVSKNDLPYYRLFTDFIGKVGTSQYTAEELDQEISIHVGNISFSNKFFSTGPENVQHKIKVDVRTTEDRVEKAIQLVAHILQESNFDEPDKVKEIIGETLAGSRSFLENNGHSAGMSRVLSHHTVAGSKKNEQSGVAFHHFLQDLEKAWDEEYTQVVEKVSAIAEHLYQKAGLTVSYTGEKAGLEAFKTHFNQFNLPEGNAKAADYTFTPEVKKEAFTNSSQIVYVSQGTNLKAVGKEVNGALLVAQNMLRMDYLWNKVRAIGGAYGVGISISLNGNVAFYSYRDPNIVSTLDAYNHTADFIDSLELDSDAIERLIIGTIGSMDNPLTPHMVGERADANYFNGVSEEDRKRIRQEVLQTTLEDLKATAEVFRAIDEKQSIVVIGSERTVEENKTLFDTIGPVFK